MKAGSIGSSGPRDAYVLLPVRQVSVSGSRSSCGRNGHGQASWLGCLMNVSPNEPQFGATHRGGYWKDVCPTQKDATAHAERVGSDGRTTCDDTQTGNAEECNGERWHSAEVTGSSTWGLLVKHISR
jgi:hypothetical protein